jgi:hypothetical protein
MTLVLGHVEINGKAVTARYRSNCGKAGGRKPDRELREALYKLLRQKENRDGCRGDGNLRFEKAINSIKLLKSKAPPFGGAMSRVFRAKQRA